MTAKKPNGYAQWLTTAGGRRFMLTVGSGLVYTGLLMGRWLSGTEYVTLQVATVAAYLAANTIQKVRAAE